MPPTFRQRGIEKRRPAPRGLAVAGLAVIGVACVAAVQTATIGDGFVAVGSRSQNSRDASLIARNFFERPPTQEPAWTSSNSRRQLDDQQQKALRSAAANLMKSRNKDRESALQGDDLQEEWRKKVERRKGGKKGEAMESTPRTSELWSRLDSVNTDTYDSVLLDPMMTRIKKNDRRVHNLQMYHTWAKFAPKEEALALDQFSVGQQLSGTIEWVLGGEREAGSHVLVDVGAESLASLHRSEFTDGFPEVQNHFEQGTELPSLRVLRNGEGGLELTARSGDLARPGPFKSEDKRNKDVSHVAALPDRTDLEGEVVEFAPDAVWLRIQVPGGPDVRAYMHRNEFAGDFYDTADYYTKVKVRVKSVDVRHRRCKATMLS